MKRRRVLITAVATVLIGLIPVPLLAAPADAAARPVSCKSSSHPALAAKLDHDIDRALRGRVSAVAIGVDDPGQGLQCWLNSSAHFDSASVVKVIILSALLRKAQEQYRYLTRTEAALAKEMITESDNGAASDLWDDVGRYDLQLTDAAALAGRARSGTGTKPSRTVATAVTNPRLRFIAVLAGLAACGGGPWPLADQ